MTPTCHPKADPWAADLCRKCFQGSHPEMDWPTVDELYARQDGRCGICGYGETGNRRMAVDHDHVSGKIRALLCSRCNTAIGMLRDSAELADRAAEYLRKHRPVVVPEAPAPEKPVVNPNPKRSKRVYQMGVPFKPYDEHFVSLVDKRVRNRELLVQRRRTREEALLDATH